MENLSDEKKRLLNLDVCPCCGAENADQFFEECRSCGALPVGAPLAPPENLLPSYWRALGAAAGGALLPILFLISSFAAWLNVKPLRFGFWDFAAAGETAAWRLKFIALPVALFVFWMSRRVLRRVQTEPTRFTGSSLARFGAVSSVSFIFIVALFIGITVPARFEQRKLARRAEREAQGYALMNLLIKYKMRFGTFPSDLNAERLKEIGADEQTLALVSKLKNVNYVPTSDIAATLPAFDAKSRALRGAAATRIRPVALKSGADASASRIDDATLTGLPFTSFKLTIPGDEGLFGREDDVEITESGVVTTATPAKASAQATPR
jgi:ribosomal protein L40E